MRYLIIFNKLFSSTYHLSSSDLRQSMMAWLPRMQYPTIMIFLQEITTLMVKYDTPRSESYLNCITKEMDNLVQFKADEETKKSNVGIKFPTLNIVDQNSTNTPPMCYIGGNTNFPQNKYNSH